MKIVGIAIGGTKSAVTLANIGDNIDIIKKVSFPTHSDDANTTFNDICNAIDSLNAKFEEISVICGGPLSSKKGIIMSPSNLPGFINFPIVKLLKNKYKVNVNLLNDADACALAEFKFGSYKGFNNFIYVTFGTGIGAGLILNGKLYSGTCDGAGEIGHVRIKRTSLEARNGKKGSVESLASGGGIQDFAKHIYDKEIYTKEVFALARNGDKKAIKIVDIAIKALGEAISILIDLFNPEAIVIGGIYPRNLDLLEAKVKKVAKRNSLKLNYKCCQILPASLGENIDEYSSLMSIKEFL